MTTHQSATEDKRTQILHDIAVRAAKETIDNQLDIALQTLEFYNDIEGKTADDIRKIKDQEKFIEKLNGEDYRNRLQNAVVESFNILSSEHLERYHSDLVYSESLNEVDVQMIPAMAQIQEELIHGIFNKPTLQ